MANRFEGKVVFITGGAIGFGRAFGRAFSAEGAAIAIADIDLPAAEAEAASLVAAGHQAVAVDCDVASEAQVDAAVATVVRDLGGVDILINNAARHLTKYNRPFSVQPREDIRAIFDTNVVGVVNCTLACRDSMDGRGGGAVLNISSISGFRNTTPYGVSKLAVRGLTIAFATELAPQKIRVNAIAPGLMATENALVDLPPQLVEEFAEKLQLVKRTGTMDDIVSAGLFLCSDEASFVTGQTLQVSGGYPLSI